MDEDKIKQEAEEFVDDVKDYTKEHKNFQKFLIAAGIILALALLVKFAG